MRWQLEVPMSTSEKRTNVEFNIACRTITIEDVIRCSYSLSKSELRVLKYLMVKGSSTVLDIAKDLRLERSTVQKILRKLVEKKVVYRKQINLKRGYKYIYVVKNLSDIKKEILFIIERWYHEARSAVESWI